MRKPNLILAGVLLGLSTSAMAFLSIENASVKLPESQQKKNASIEKAVDLLPMAKMAARTVASGLYVYSIGGNNNCPIGFFRTDLDGSLEHLWNPAKEGWNMFNGWMYDGRVTGFIQHQSNGVYDGIELIEHDFETGEVVNSRVLDASDYNTWFTHCEYIPQNELIFGLGRDEKNWDTMKTMNIKDLNDIVNLCTVYYDDLIVAITYNPYDGDLYAVTRTKDFVRINMETGKYEYLWKLPLPDLNNNYKMALTYLPNADEYLFGATLNDADYSTVYYRIDLESEMIAESAQLADANVITFFINTDEKDMQAPLRPEYVGMDFPDGSLSGTFKFNMSKVLAGGDAASDLTWTFYADGVEMSSGTAAGGSSVDVAVELAQGMHTIELGTANGSHSGPSYKTQLYIGKDTPKAPAHVVLKEGNVSWDAVTEGVNDGYLNLAEMYYEVYINDEYVGETEQTSFDFTIAPTEAFGKHVATVRAICDDMESSAGVSNAAIYGSSMNLDVFFTPNQDEAALFTTVSEDTENAINWGWNNWEDAFGTEYPWGNSYAWLVTPPLNMDDADIVYALEFDAKAVIYGEGESSLSVYLGSSQYPEDMTEVLMEEFCPAADEYTKYRAIFCVPEASKRYIGFQAVVDRLTCEMYVRNISVKKTSIPTCAPGAVTNLKAMEGENGQLSATIAFSMPTSDLKGRELASDAMLSAVVNAGEKSITVTGVPGQSMTVEIETTQGDNNITVTSVLGEETGDTASVNVYTGIDRPGNPGNFKAIAGEDNTTVIFTWDTPTDGEQGKYFEAKDISYIISYRVGWSTYEISDIPVDATEFVYTMPEGTQLNNYSFNITPSNIAGQGVSANATVMLGKPYELPMNEEFTNNRYTYAPFDIVKPSAEYESSMLFFQPPYYFDEMFEKYDHGAVTAFTTEEGDTKSRLVFPKFSTVNLKNGVNIHIEVWTGERSAKKMTLFGNTYFTDQPIEIGTIDKGTGWAEVNFTLPEEMLGKEWCEIFIESEYDRPDTYTMIYSYSIDQATEIKEVESSRGVIQTMVGAICIIGYDNEAYAIYGIDGQLLNNGNVDSERYVVELTPGIYVVRIADKSVKVIVK